MKKQENQVKGKGMQHSGYCRRKTFIFLLLIIAYLLINNNIYSRDYVDSNLNLSFFIGLDLENNQISNKEDDMAFENNCKEPGTTIFHGGFQMDLLTPPLTSFVDDKFILKLGLTGRTGWYTYDHYFTYNNKEIEEPMIEYDYWQVGPSILIVHHEEILDVGGFLYAYYGPLKGDIHAAAGLRKIGVPYSESDCETGITGNKFKFGFRIIAALNKWVPIYGCIGYYYTRTHIDLDHRLPVYGDDVGNDVTSHGFGLELFLGVYF